MHMEKKKNPGHEHDFELIFCLVSFQIVLQFGDFLYHFSQGYLKE